MKIKTTHVLLGLLVATQAPQLITYILEIPVVSRKIDDFLSYDSRVEWYEQRLEYRQQYCSDEERWERTQQVQQIWDAQWEEDLSYRESIRNDPTNPLNAFPVPVRPIAITPSEETCLIDYDINRGGEPQPPKNPWHF